MWLFFKNFFSMHTYAVIAYVVCPDVSMSLSSTIVTFHLDELVNCDFIGYFSYHPVFEIWNQFLKWGISVTYVE